MERGSSRYSASRMGIESGAGIAVLMVRYLVFTVGTVTGGDHRLSCHLTLLSRESGPKGPQIRLEWNFGEEGGKSCANCAALLLSWLARGKLRSRLTERG